jgi:hypothetical protein
LFACAASENGEDAGTTGVPGPGSGDAGETASEADTAGAAETTSAASTDAASSDGGDEGGQAGSVPIAFDLGTIPDAGDGLVPCVQDVDIVFVMDVSTSMGGLLATLADEILVVDAALAEFRLPSAPHYGLVVFVDDAAVLNGGAPYADAVALQQDFETWSAFTSSNEQVGGGNGNSTFTENSLDGLYLAASEFAWRPADETLRIVIHTTDDTFWDGPTTGNGVPIEHSYGETVQALQDQTVRVFAFADPIGGSCNCEDTSPGWFGPYEGAPAIPVATDGAASNIQDILAGTVSLADAIFDSVADSYCDPYTPQR